MSACPTCAHQAREMPSRILVIIDGDTYTQPVSTKNRLDDLLKAANFILRLADQESAKGAPSHG